MSDTREYIIDQSYSLFLSRSYEAVSISDISKAIGFTKGALYHHFTNKEELFKAVIDKYLKINELSLFSDTITLADFIEESVNCAKQTLLLILGEKPAFIPISYISLFIDAFRHYPQFAQDKEELLTREVEKIKTVMDNAVKRGEIRNDINTSLMATNYFSISMGIAQNMLHNNSPQMAIDSLHEQLQEFYKVIKI
jgi:TetR/AcrR family transcriptional regulator, transcriptional repressor for nem operon